MKTLVSGPPCGGKTTFARSRSDSVLDYDDLVEELGGDRYGKSPEAYAAWLARLPLHEWVVWTAPRRKDRGRFRSQWNARVVVVLASLEVCHSRAEKERPPAWHALIDEWFAAFEPSTSGRELIVRTD
jgi:predicted kinase